MRETLQKPAAVYQAAHTRVLYLVTSSLSTTLMRGQLRYLSERKFDVFLASAPGDHLAAVSKSEQVEAMPIPMAREISPLRDFWSLLRLCWLMRRLRPIITNASTPKAGLLGGMAAFLTGVPCRIYTLRGLRAETASGLKKKILLTTEWVACHCAHEVICVSRSLREKAIAAGLVEPRRAVVLGHGSSNGVDCERFLRTPERQSEAAEMRRALGIPASAPLIGFAGRFTRDKGIAELYRAYTQLKQSFPEVRLLMLGDFESGDPVDQAVRQGLESDPHVIRPGMVPDTAPYYVVMDVLALPTYREGFPNAPLEAQASGVPVVTTNATGAVDSVLDGVTGKLVQPRDATALATALGELLADPEACHRMGAAAADWVRDNFHREIIWQALIVRYNRLLQQQATAPTQSGVRGAIKSLCDRVGAATLLVVVLPALAVIALLVRMKMGSPVLFRQRRPGKDEKIFELVKFRNMTDARDETGRLLPDEARLTGLGRWLRSLSLDELPQLWNVLRGEMSFVGPRPLLIEYLPRYTAEQARRHKVKPGITGWAQVNGRNAITWEEKFALDTWYVDHWSLWLDLKILAMTVWRVVKREGISQAGQATMPEFFGAGQKESGR